MLAPSHPDHPAPAMQPPLDQPVLGLARVFSLAWRGFARQYPMLLVVLAIDLVHGLAIAILQGMAASVPAASLAISWLLSFFVAFPLTAGTAYVGVKAARGERIRAADVFLGFSRYPSIVVIGVFNTLMSLILLAPLACAVGFAAMGLGSAMGRSGAGVSPLEMLVLVVGIAAIALVGGIVAIRFSLAPMVCLDPGWGRLRGIDCIRASWRLTAGVWWTMIIAYVLMGLIVAGSFLLLIVGIFFLGWPLAMVITGSVYAVLAAPFVQPVATALSPACAACGYDLSGLAPGTCPECGAGEPA